MMLFLYCYFLIQNKHFKNIYTFFLSNLHIFEVKNPFLRTHFFWFTIWPLSILPKIRWLLVGVSLDRTKNWPFLYKRIQYYFFASSKHKKDTSLTYFQTISTLFSDLSVLWNLSYRWERELWYRETVLERMAF